MRLISATIRHYRVHHELQLTFDPSRTLIGGPNECGKSTAIEAIHRALFLKARATGDVQRGMVSHSSPGTPEVDVVFDVGDRRYQLIKRFSGNGGTTRLTQIGGETLTGDEAEEHLARLLGVEQASGGRGMAERVAQQWAHLWVWQGQSGSDPTTHATTQRDGLLQRLQESGGAAAMQSALDAEVAAIFAEATAATFVKDRPKTGSDLERAESAATQAESRFTAASERLARLRQAVTDYEDAGHITTRAEIDLVSLRDQLTAVETKQIRLAELRQQEIGEAATFRSAQERCTALEKTQSQIATLQSRIRELDEALAPKTAAIERLKDAWTELRSHAEQSLRDYETSCDTTRLNRQRHDLASSCVTRYERAARLAELSKKATQIEAVEKSLAELREHLAKLPEIDAAKVKKLQKLDGEASRAEATLQAMAASIDVVAAGVAVTLHGETIPPGGSKVIVDEAELVIGTDTRIRIRPGGGTSLAEARQQAHDARHALTKALDAAGVASVSTAGEVLARRADLSTRINAAADSLETLDATNLSALLEEATDASTAAEAEVTRRSAAIPDFALPASLAAARHLQSEQARLLAAAEAAERKAKTSRDTSGKKATDAEAAIQTARQEVERHHREIADFRAQLGLLLDTHGNDDQRARLAKEAAASREQAGQLLEATRRAIADLQPDLLTTDHARLQRAITQTEKTKGEAETRRAVAEGALRSDGTDDPQAALALAQAQHAAAREQLASVRKKAEAVRLLNQLFLEEQKALSERFTQPLAEKISGYLQCLFGSGARASVVLTDNAFSGLQIFRPGKEVGAIRFDSLSGGTKEQVAAAMRLALAEVLAADHAGCLPVVFDDAFAYSDPDRVQALQRMLDLAAARGMQVIVLTCTPSDYSSLGAHTVFLRPTATAAMPRAVRPPDPTQDTDSSSSDDDTPDGQPIEVTDAERQSFRNALQETGGKAGNIALRQTLGWDEATYEAVRDALVASGEITPGRGRGGSVSLSNFS
jgi:DNA repair exonuclease SbcCD ATPase subunit